MMHSEKQSPTHNDWENAKAYWKSLTTQERRQLEKEAMEDVNMEADAEEDDEPKPPKPEPKVPLKGGLGDRDPFLQMPKGKSS